MTSDQLNRTGSIKYDYRNLMTEIRAIKTEANPDPFGTPTIDVLYLTQYRYDEAGNRVRKFRYKYTGSDPEPIFNGDSPSWTLQSDEYYVRDLSGKEIALYSGSSLTQWNIWGLDNPPGGGQVVGKIPACRNGSSGRNADTTRNYYLKDHLGSIRVVLNSTNTVVSAQDYDACLTYSALAEEVGYPLENRAYNSSAMKYDFTGKERDNETSYDYFGARYFNSRVGRWNGMDNAYDSYIQFSPYVYTINNPLKFIDPNGLNIDFADYIENNGKDDVYKIIAELEKITGLSLFLEGSTLKYGNGFKGGSSDARIALINAIDNTDKTINVKYTEGETQAVIGGYDIEFNPKDPEAFSRGSYGGLNSLTLGYGMTFLHEVLHTGLGLGVGDDQGFGNTGPVVDAMNKIQSQLGKSFGQRLSYNPLQIGNIRYIPFDKASLEVMSNVYQKYSKGQEGFNFETFNNALLGTKYIKYEK